MCSGESGSSLPTIWSIPRNFPPNSSLSSFDVTVDKGDESWKGKTGVVPVIVKELSIDAENTIALACGPPVMIKFTLPVLAELGLAPQQTYLSLEMKMKCGIGKCGRCNIGSKYVCTDGPVFSLAQLNLLPQEY